MLLGGGQERDRRSGTQTVAGDRRAWPPARGPAPSDRKAVVDRVAVAARPPGRRAARRHPRRGRDAATARHKVASNCHLCIPGVEAEALLFLLDQDGVCASAASSCASGAAEPSHVLAALGVPADARAAGRCGCRSAGPPPTPMSTRGASTVVPAAVAPAAAREGPRRHDRRRRLVGGGRAAGRRRPRRHRRDAAAVGRRVRHRVLLGVRRRRRPAGGRPARHRPPRVQLRRRTSSAHVVEPYVADHRAGRTPNPCIECNRHLKFDRLLRRADQLGFDAVATGHHARIARPARTARGSPAAPIAAKDQSYVLHMLDQATLARTLFPIGGLTKDEVRAHGRRARAAHRGQARQPGRVLHHLGRGPGRVPRPADRRSRPGVVRRPAGRRGRAGCRGRAGHGRPAAGPRPARWRPAAVRAAGRARRRDASRSAPPTTCSSTGRSSGPVSWADGPVHGDLLAQCSAHGRAEPAVVEPGPDGAVTRRVADPSPAGRTRPGGRALRRRRGGRRRPGLGGRGPQRALTVMRLRRASASTSPGRVGVTRMSATSRFVVRRRPSRTPID